MQSTGFCLDEGVGKHMRPGQRHNRMSRRHISERCQNQTNRKTIPIKGKSKVRIVTLIHPISSMDSAKGGLSL